MDDKHKNSINPNIPEIKIGQEFQCNGAVYKFEIIRGELVIVRLQILQHIEVKLGFNPLNS